MQPNNPNIQFDKQQRLLVYGIIAIVIYLSVILYLAIDYFIN